VGATFLTHNVEESHLVPTVQ